MKTSTSGSSPSSGQTGSCLKRPKGSTPRLRQLKALVKTGPGTLHKGISCPIMYKGKKPIANFSANKPRASAQTPSTPATTMATTQPGPNQPGMFGAQGGVPMDISKAHAEGKCTWCGKPWPCAEHMRPRRIHEMTFRGHQIRYTNSDELAAEIQRIEKDFPSKGK